MTDRAASGASTGSSTGSSGRPRPTPPFASPRLFRFLAGAGLVIGWLTTIGTAAYAVNGVTQAGGPVRAPVDPRAGVAVEAPGTDPVGPAALAVVQGREPRGESLRLEVPGAARGSWVEVHPGALTVRSWGSTVPEQLLNRGGIAVVGLCIGVASVLVRRLLVSIADSRPFEPGNATRIAGVAGLVVVASLANDLLAALGSNLVLERLGLGGPESPVVGEAGLSVVPLLVAPLLLALAEAFRRGTELSRDLEGLV